MTCEWAVKHWKPTFKSSSAQARHTHAAMAWHLCKQAESQTIQKGGVTAGFSRPCAEEKQQGEDEPSA